MRRMIVIMSLLIGLLLPLSAANMQKIYSVDSPEYEALTLLSIHQGLALPSTAGPYSGDELVMIVRRIDAKQLQGPYKELYEELTSSLAPPEKSVTVTLNATLEGYLHSNTQDFTTDSDWNFNYQDRSPLLDIVLETSLGDYVYGFTSLPIQGSKFSYETWATQPDPVHFNFGTEVFSTNLGFFGNLSNELDMGVPYRAFGAIGGEHFSFQIGREQLSWGAGKTGNFMVGDHLKYHNTARFTAYSDSFKYTLLTSFFPYPDDYYTNRVRTQMNLVQGLNMFLAHRIEWTLFQKKVGMALSEAIIYQSEDNTLDLRILSPTAIFHNFYIKNHSNSLLTFEVDYTPIKGLNVYTQIVLDEFAVPGAEGSPGVAPSADPGAWGVLSGVQGTFSMKDILLYGSIEGSYTNPYLYLRSKDGNKQNTDEAGINFVVAVPERFMNGYGVYYDEQFLGYRYGPDAIVINANLGAKKIGSWSVETTLFTMIHGTTDQWTLFDKVTPPGGLNPYQSTPTTNHPTANALDPQANLRNSASTTIDLTLKGSYQVLPTLTLFAQGDYIWIKNPKNISTNPPIHDLQLSFGIRYTL